MQSLNPDPKAQYTSVHGALKKIIRTEGFWRPLRGLNVMMMGAGPAHALYFACYENVKRTLNAVFHHQGNSHLANGIRKRLSGVRKLCPQQTLPQGLLPVTQQPAASPPPRLLMNKEL